jgi:hypothetical protein
VDLDYRTELKTLNDLNFARFDAKLEQRFAEQEARLIRWMFALWTTTMVTQAGLFLAVLRLK